jgi:hypothetical protein
MVLNGRSKVPADRLVKAEDARGVRCLMLRPTRLERGQKWGWGGEGRFTIIKQDWHAYDMGGSTKTLNLSCEDHYGPFDGGIFSTFLGYVDLTKEAEFIEKVDKAIAAVSRHTRPTTSSRIAEAVRANALGKCGCGAQAIAKPNGMVARCEPCIGAFMSGQDAEASNRRFWADADRSAPTRLPQSHATAFGGIFDIRPLKHRFVEEARHKYPEADDYDLLPDAP